MTRQTRPFPRRRSDPPAPVPAPPPPATIEPLALLRQADIVAHVPDVDAAIVAGPDIGVDRQWQVRLSEIGVQYGLTDLQEAEFQRLAERQQQRIREEIPRLIEETRPHFDTPGEAEAKRRYEENLRTLKAELDRETMALLQSFVRELT